jgi:hypothetical protein
MQKRRLAAITSQTEICFYKHFLNKLLAHARVSAETPHELRDLRFVPSDQVSIRVFIAI